MQVPNPPPLGYIPMGTTNDVASTLGLPKNATDAALRIVTGTPTAFDVGSFGDKSFFTYVAAFGAFTAVAMRRRRTKSRRSVIWPTCSRR